MKKLLLGTTLLCLGAAAFGQGTIRFANTATSLVFTSNIQGQLSPADSTYFHVALYWGVLGSNEAQLVQIGPNGEGDTSGTTGGLNPILPGRFANGVEFHTGLATAPSATATFQV